MPEGTEEQRTQIIAHLERLNSNVERQMSLTYGLRNGVVYGFGFVIGSTLLTAAIVTFGLTFFSNTLFGDVIAWIVATLR